MSRFKHWFFSFAALCGACAASAGSDPAPSVSQAEPLQVVAEGEDAPWRVAVDGRYLYWTTRTALRRAPLAGGPATTLAMGSFQRVVAADGGVFVTAGAAGKVYRVDRERGDSVAIGSGEQPDGIAVHGRHVYWTNAAMELGAGTVAQAGLDGSKAKILAENLVGPSGVAANDAFVYFASNVSSCGRDGCVGGGVAKLTLADRSLQVMDAQSTVADVVLGKRGAYWLSRGTVVMFADFSGAAAKALTEPLQDEAGPIAIDDEALYLSTANRGRALKVGLDGGEPQALVTDLGVIGGLAVDRDWLYVTALHQGRVLRVAKDGRAAKPSGPVSGPCPTPLGAAAEIAATPRANPNLELLALSIDAGRVTASDESYARVLADVAAIRQAEPLLAGIQHFPRSDGRQLLLSPNELTLQSMRAGEYSAWDCLNEFYGLEDTLLGSTYVVLTLKGIYDLELLSALYKKLPGIQGAESNRGGGDGPTICAKRDGTTYEYVVDRAGGDCPAGCTTHEAHAFVSSAAGVIEAKGVWNSETGEGSSEMFTKLCR